MSRRGRIPLPRSMAARFVLLYLAISIVGTVPVLLFIYHQTNRVVLKTYQARLEDRREILLRSYETGGIPMLAQLMRDRIATGVAAHGGSLLVDRDGRRIAGNIAQWPPTLQQQTEWAEMYLYRDGHDQAELFALDTVHFSSGHRLLIAVLIEDRSRMRGALFMSILGALVLAFPIGLAGSLVMLRASNRRVNAIGNVAARIAAGDLSHRVEVDGADSGFTRIAEALNLMLERIETLVGEIRFVTDALAHDLRSPLTRIRASIETAIEQPSEELRAQAIEAIAHEVDGMLRMIASTLEISRAEAGMGRENFACFDLGALIHDLCEMYQPLADERGISIHVEEPRKLDYFGNRELIGQAVSNLVDNALKYGADGGSIRFGADEIGSAIRLWVADQGAGIPADRRDEAMGKYRRLDEARATEGSGLGLSLVRAVANLHGGELLLEDNAPGLRAVLILPRTSST